MRFFMVNPLFNVSVVTTGSAAMPVQTEPSGLIWPLNWRPVNVYDPSVPAQFTCVMKLPSWRTAYVPLQLSAKVPTGLLCGRTVL